MINSDLKVDIMQDVKRESSKVNMIEIGPQQNPLPKMNLDNQQVELYDENFMLQAHPRQPGWPELPPRLEEMRTKQSVDIYKTPDQNLEIILDSVFKTCKCIAEIKREFRLALLDIEGDLYDLSDFEVKGAKPWEIKIFLDSAIHFMKAIVLVRLKPKP